MCNLPNQEHRENPFFSVILPIYNVEAYLEQCIRSVLEQGFADYELILVDDGSQDQCPAICDRYAEQYPNIRVVHKVNGGLGSARNAGIEVAIGRYIWFVDSDDWMEADSLQILHNACKASPDIIKFNFAQNSKEHSVAINQIPEGMYNLQQDRNRILDLALLKTNRFSLSACTQAYRRAFVQKNQLTFASERIVGSEDFLFNLQAFALADTLCVIQDGLYHYRIREGSLTRQYRSKLYSQYTELYQQIRAFYRKNGILEQCESRISYFYVWCLLHGTCFSNEYRVSANHTPREGRKNVRKILKDSNFRYAAKKCCRAHFNRKHWLQLQAMRLGLEPVFYWLYVKKPQRQKGLRYETKNSPAQEDLAG